MSSIIALRFPGWDPERFLNWLYPKVSWFFTPAVTSVNLLIMLAAALLVLLNLPEFARRVPEFQQFFGLNNLLFMACILMVTKSIHELGHGLMCKHFGGECHEIGFMLLVLTPAMYCNTSDSWTLPNKWHRIAIGAAGMYVEVVLAAVCTLVWWNTHPGFLHYLCLNVMFLSSVSTVVFNLNPLLRYDGYYMLSDYLEIPNLSQKSKMAMLSKLRVWCLGMKPFAERMLPQRKQFAFAVYSVASFLYRWLVIGMIFWFLNEVLEPYGLQVIAQIVVLISIVGMVVVPLYKLGKFFLYPGRFREVKKVRLWFTTVALLAGLVIMFLVPLPHSAWVHFVIRPDEAQSVYVDLPGTIAKCHVQEGDRVIKGQMLAELENTPATQTLLDLEGKLAAEKAKLASWQAAQDNLPQAASLMVESKLEIASLESKIELQKLELSKLTLRADRDGVVMAPPNRPAASLSSMNEPLRRWSGSPLDKKNLNGLLERKTLFCFVGDPEKMKAVMVVDQGDVKFIQPDQNVDLVLNQFRDRRLSGKVRDVSRDELPWLPRELSKTNGGPIAGVPDLEGRERPLLKAYEATATLQPNEEVKLFPGMYGSAKVRIGNMTLGWRMWRALQQMINF